MTDNTIQVDRNSRINMREPNGRWKKGGIANPKGRAKGQCSEHHRRFLEVKDMASENASKAFEMLWEAMLANESWAYQIYFKELYSLPKNYGQKVVVIPKEERSLEGQIKVLTERLPEFDEVTQAESLERLKVLNSLKYQDNSLQNDIPRESKESLREKVEMIQTIIEFKDKG